MPNEKDFTPLPNPYIVGNPIKSGEMFYGRQEEFLFIQRKIETGDKNYVIVLCGERRSGKTSILFQILSGKLGEKFLPVLIDMQTMAGLESDAGFFAEIAQEICRTLKEPRLNFRQYNFHAPGESPYKCFQTLLDDVLGLHPGKHLVLMIDEYEMIEEKFEEGSLSADLTAFFAGLLESARRVSFVFTGSRHLEQRKRLDYWRVLFGKSLYRRISFLSRDDTIRLITEPVRNWITFQDQVIPAIYRLTAGQPFYTQVVCQNLIDHLNEHQKNVVAPEDLEIVTEGILQNPLPQMIYIWNSLTDMEKLALTVLAELQPHTKGFVPVAKFQHFLKAKDTGFVPARKDLTTALEHLYERELVIKKEETYRIPIELLGQWVRREFSFWRTIQEMLASGAYAQTLAVEKARRRKVSLVYVLAGAALLAVAVFLFQRQTPPEKIAATSTLDSAKTGRATPPTNGENRTNSLKPGERQADQPATQIPERNKRPLAKDESAALSRMGKLRVDSQPGGAAIFLNAGLLQDRQTPEVIENLAAGNYRLQVKKSGYRLYDTNIIIIAGDTARVSVTLEKLPPAFVNIHAIPYAKIYLDEVFKKEINKLFLMIEPGLHKIKLEHPVSDTLFEINAIAGDTVYIKHSFLNQ